MNKFLLFTMLLLSALCLRAEVEPSAGTYRLVENEADLTVGAKYILVSSNTAGDAVAMSTNQKDKNRGTIPVTVNQDLTATPPLSKQ